MIKTPQFGRAFRACSAGFHVQPLVRPFLVQALAELVELVLLVKEFLAAGCFPAARQVEEPEVEVLTSQDMFCVCVVQRPRLTPPFLAINSLGSRVTFRIELTLGGDH